MLDLGIVENLLDRVDRRVGNAVRVQSGEPIFPRLLAKLRSQDIDDLVVTVGAPLARIKARVADQMIELGRSQLSFPRLVVPR